MVNYCCVYGCGRNSRQSSHLNYYSMPKEKERMIDWLTLAGRDDLIKKIEDNVTLSQRICSRHFPNSAVKNRNLIPDAVPSLCLPGSDGEDSSSSADKKTSHDSIVCNNCQNLLLHFRYKCVNCKDYDLCPKCEMREVHPEHFMLRIPRAMKFKHLDNLVKNWKKFFKENHITPDSVPSGSESDDDEPIVKYSKTYDSGVDLSEDVKANIKNIVKNCLNIKKEPKVIAKKVPVKKVPEVIFADVNEVKQEYISLSDSDIEEIEAGCGVK